MGSRGAERQEDTRPRDDREEDGEGRGVDGAERPGGADIRFVHLRCPGGATRTPLDRGTTEWR